MTPREALQVLIERIEKADQPSIELFIDVMKALGGAADLDWQERFYDFVGLYAYLDAAVALAERVVGARRAQQLLHHAITWLSLRKGESLATKLSQLLVLAVCRAKLAEMPE